MNFSDTGEVEIPRLFTGIQIPEEISSELSLVRGGLSGARWIEPADYHVTLRFLGDVSVEIAEHFCFELGRREKPALALSFDGLSFFGGSRPRALIAQIKPTSGLHLQADHERVARKAGLVPETRKFTPHVTIARLSGVRPESVAGYLSGRGFLASNEFRAREFVVYSSRGSTGGGPYVVEAVYPLRDEGSGLAGIS